MTGYKPTLKRERGIMLLGSQDPRKINKLFIVKGFKREL